MCYSARCLWEDYMGDCLYPYRTKNINPKYRCGINIQDYLFIQRQIKRNKVVLERKEKIIYLKTKLLQKSEYI
jgi:hypothetical protein